MNRPAFTYEPPCRIKSVFSLLTSLLCMIIVWLALPVTGRAEAGAGGREALIQVTRLSCNHQIRPLNLDQAPRFGWQITAGEQVKHVLQTAYQIQVATSRQALENGHPDYWDSKKVISDRQLEIPYGGKVLSSFQELFWRVRIWTTKGSSAWSPPERWRMGFLKLSDQLGSWIGYDHPFAWDRVTKFPVLSSRYLRKAFKADKHIKSAVAYISGLGLYELHINGKKAGDAVLAPAPTDYTKTVLYNALDVTDLVQTGENAIGVILGNGRFFAMRQDYKPWKWRTFGFPKLYFQLRINYEDGSVENVVSDSSWQLTGRGPIRNNNEYDGEVYDARMELTDWDQPGYHPDTRLWRPVEMVEAPAGKWTAQFNPPMKIMQTVHPVQVLRSADSPGHSFILDMGQNMAGWLKMQLDGSGHKGDTIQLRFAESLVKEKEGYRLYTANLRDARSTDHYIVKGAKQETWSPRFTYHGFRYVEVKGYPGDLTAFKNKLLERFTGEVIYDDLSERGFFECSDTTINQIYKNAVWGIKSNYKGMPVDCPQRNERQPWLGDRTTGAYGESFAFNNQLLYDKWLQDIQDAQLITGSIPDVAPSFWMYYKDDVTWPSTYLTVADMLYRQYGDSSVVSRHYHSMKTWILYMHHKYARNGLIDRDSYGDWCVPPDSLKVIHSSNPAKITPGGLIATATFYHDLQLMSLFAALNGTLQDTALFNPMAREMKASFNKKYFHADSACYGNNTVTGNLLALAFRLAEPQYEQKIFKQIVHKTAVTYDNHISSGVIGIQWLLRTLSRFGRNDLALKVAANRTYPGWGYMVAHGATTIWELWNGNTANPAMNSQNHVMLLGDLLIWLYENQAGIQSDDKAVGFKRIRLAPDITGHLNYVKAIYDCPYGPISSWWQKKGDKWQWEVTIPAGTVAEIQFPTALKDIKEAAKAPKGLLSGPKGASLERGSGHYVFEGKLPVD